MITSIRKKAAPNRSARGNALSLAAMRATLKHVLTNDAFAHKVPMAERWIASVAHAIADFALPRKATCLGCRAVSMFTAQPPRNGTEAQNAIDFELERFMHIYAINLLAFFHYTALISPQTTAADIDRHIGVFRCAANELVG